MFLLPVQAQARADDPAALAAYARARLAGGSGALDSAVQGYATALALAPANELLAARALSQAIAAGDRNLALQAARLLEASDKLPNDGRLLLTAEALRTRDWKSALRHVEALERHELFGFMAPVLRAWIAHGSRKGDPMAPLDAAASNALASSYAAEHRPLILLARGDGKNALPLLAPLFGEGGMRGQRLQIATAAFLARKQGRDEALAVLRGTAGPVQAARALIEAKKRLRGEIATPAEGAGELLTRMAIEIGGAEVPELALSFARLATFAAPENSFAWLVTAELLGEQRQYEPALAALAKIDARDPFAAAALERRLNLLTRAGRAEEALAEARRAAEAQPQSAAATLQLGSLLSRANRYEEAAAVYGRALEIHEAQEVREHPEWLLWLMRGAALREAGRWPEAKKDLQQAYKLAPDQPQVLNDLGYSLLERREDLEEAERLIREASRLEPDDGSITDSLGWAHYVRGDIPRSLQLLEAAAQKEPADPAINEHLGDVYYSAGRRFEARYAWHAALLYAEGKAAERLRAKIEAGLKPELAAP